MRNSILVIAIAFALAAPCSAIAGGKQSGGSSSKQTAPTESVNLNYGKVESSYAKQQSKSSGPNLYRSTATGKHFKKATITVR
jgi:type VI protein secretion system component Hcp